MKINNKDGNVIVVMLVLILIIGTLLYFFLPKKLFNSKSSGSSNTFGTFQNDKRHKNDGVPAPLKWKRSFAYDKKEEKQQGSYMRYMIDKNKNK